MSQSPSSFLGFIHEILPSIRAEINSARSGGLQSEVKEDGSWVTAADRNAEIKFRELVRQKFPDHGILGEEFGLENADSDYRWVIDPIDGTSEFRCGMPEWGTVIGLFYKGKNIAGVIDCSDLDYLVSAADACGAYLNHAGQISKLEIKEKDIDPKLLPRHKIKMGISPSFSFDRFGRGESHIFNKLCATFPNQRVLHNAYIHVLVAIGALNFSVEYSVRLWDIASLEVIMKEAGGAYRLLSRYEFESDEIYSVLIGEANLVEQAARVIDESKC